VVADRGDDDGAEGQKCAAQGLTVDLPHPQPAAKTQLGLCGKECWTYHPAQDVSVGPAGAPVTSRVGTEEQGRQIRSYATAACGRCALNARGTRNNANRRMTRWEDEDVLERRQPRLESHAAMRRKRKAMGEPPLGTLKRWRDQGDLLRRGQPKVRTARSLSRLAYNSKRGLNILGVQAMLEALAGNRLFTPVRGPKSRTSNLQVNPRHLAPSREFRRLLTARVLVISQFAGQVFTQSGPWLGDRGSVLTPRGALVQHADRP
jgi:hypothetical protein